MSITTPQKDWQAGAILTAADLDTYLSANIKGVLDALMPGGVKTHFIPAQQFVSTRGSPAHAVVGSGGNELRMDAWGLDQTTPEAITAQWYSDWDPALGTVTAEIYWSPASTNTGNAMFQVMATDVAAAEQVDQAVDEAEAVTQAANGTLEALHITTAVTLNRTGRFLRLTVYRDAGNAGDTFTADANVHGLLLKFTPA